MSGQFNFQPLNFSKLQSDHSYNQQALPQLINNVGAQLNNLGTAWDGWQDVKKKADEAMKAQDRLNQFKGYVKGMDLSQYGDMAKIAQQGILNTNDESSAYQWYSSLQNLIWMQQQQKALEAENQRNKDLQAQLEDLSAEREQQTKEIDLNSRTKGDLSHAWQNADPYESVRDMRKYIGESDESFEDRKRVAKSLIDEKLENENFEKSYNEAKGRGSFKPLISSLPDSNGGSIPPVFNVKSDFDLNTNVELENPLTYSLNPDYRRYKRMPDNPQGQMGKLSRLLAEINYYNKVNGSNMRMDQDNLDKLSSERANYVMNQMKTDQISPMAISSMKKSEFMEDSERLMRNLATYRNYLTRLNNGNNPNIEKALQYIDATLSAIGKKYKAYNQKPATSVDWGASLTDEDLRTLGLR